MPRDLQWKPRSVAICVVHSRHMPTRVSALVPRRVKAPAPRLVDNHYRVSLTKEVRRTLGVGPGDYVTFQVTDDGTV